MNIVSNIKLSKEEVLRLLNRFDDSSDAPLHQGLDFESYSEKLSEHAWFVIAEEGGAQIGFIAYYLNDEGKFGYVPQVVVHREGRHQGIGHKMFEGLYEVLKDRNFHTLKLEVLKSNQNARRFYEREGFGEIEDHCERVLLEKSL